MMRDWPLWAQIYAALSVFTFGLMLGLPPDEKIGPFYNVLLSALSAVLWPVPLVAGLLEVGHNSMRRKRD